MKKWVILYGYTKWLENIEWRMNFTTRKLWSLLKQNWLKWYRKNDWTVIRFDENVNELQRLYEEYSIIT